MAVETHRFSIGSFGCIVINDGNLTLGPTSRFFAGATPDELHAALSKHDLKPQSLDIPVSCLFVDTGQHRVLIDCGAGQDREEPQLGKLLAGLEQEGIEPASIDRVVLSHGHFDHVGGCVDSAGNPTYPNARYIMARGEWQFWAQDAALDFYGAGDVAGLTKLRDKLLAIQPQLDLIEPDCEIVTGIRALATPGHTFHHISVEVVSGDETLVCPIDTIDHPLQAEHPTWGPDWDVDREKSTASRRRVLALAADKGALAHGFHFPFPGLGRVGKDAGVWTWHWQD